MATNSTLFILHQTNCQNAFGAGFAGYITKHFPIAKERYHQYMNACISGHGKTSALGRICEVKGNGFTIVHCFGQQFYGNSKKTGKCYTIYSKLESSLAEFRRRHPDDTAICPLYMGAGLAGGDWNRILQLCYKYNIIPCDRIDLEHRVYHKAYPFGPESPKEGSKEPSNVYEKHICQDLQHPTEPFTHYEFRNYANDRDMVTVTYFKGVDNSDCNGPLEYNKKERYMTIPQAREFYKECLNAGFYNPWQKKASK